MHHYQTNKCILEHAIVGICVFFSTLFIRISLGVGVETHLHHVNAFIVEDNILWHLGDTSDYTGGHKNWSQGCKIDPITHPKPCYGYSLSLVFPRFFTFSLIFMNMQMR